MLSRAFFRGASRILQSRGQAVCRSGNRCWSVLSSTRSVSLSQRHWLNRLCACSKICVCGAHKLTQGDSDLLSFLKDEIKFEQDNSRNVPKSELFQAKVDDTIVRLEREFNGEKVVITFDINQNVNEDQSYVSDAESDNERPANEDTAGNIVSYPSFTVDVTKHTGSTLRFTCEYNQGVIPPADEGADNREEEDVFQIINVCVMDSPNSADNKAIYAAETENIDPNLYTMLLNMLAERGVDNSFGHWLLDFSTAIEHQHYIKFLKNLQGFVEED
ncbi:complement component 1 Q subcomponent-binding protein, mitochondrial [Nematostella vectensis]|uniref:complement component 1 Q subcomponent-binding protein, mitochondrial n=1 Tax=Nematostella vectensis TaxID=45351 RepID=UPI00207704B2|nr:complement component 1 Q subcomponent-binding protein, mitochondrial [Nematostella vectensis]